MKNLLKLVSVPCVVVALSGGFAFAKSDVPAEKTTVETAAAPSDSARIDQLVEKGYAANNVTPNAPANDEIFVRRIYLDIIGRVPTKAEALAFLEDQAPDKRAKLIDTLLDSEGYVANYFNYWADLLRAKTEISGNGQSRPAGLSYAAWIKQSLRENKTYDDFVREMLSASGTSWDNPAIGYYLRDYGMPLDNLAITTQVFLGTQIVCAQCHNHPFDAWTQMDYYHLAAFTNGQVTTNQSENGKAAFELAAKKFREKQGKAMKKDDRKDIQRAFSEILKPVRFNNVIETDRALRLPHDYKYDDAKPKAVVDPEVPFAPGAAVSEGESTIQAFANWVTSPENPRFTKVIANRLWKKAFGVGLIEPVDDLREDTEASNPELMAYLEQKMVDYDYDMKRFLRMVFNTETYQREASAEEPVMGMPYYFAGPILRRMSAEQIWDSLVAMTVENPDEPDAEFQLYTKRQITEVELIANAVYDQKPGQFLRNGYEIAQVQRELAAELQRTQEGLAAARESKDPVAIKAASKEAQRIRRQLSLEVENRVFREGLEEKLTLVAANGADDDAFLADLLKTVSVENESSPVDGMGSIIGQQDGVVRQLVSAMVAEDQKALRAEQNEREVAERAAWGVNDKEAKRAYKIYDTIRERMKRAADIQSPAPGGHFLREFGQSDREVVENANDQASITQALALLNGPIIGGITSRYSVLGRDLKDERSFDERLDTIFLSMLSRYPDAEERKILKQAWNESDGTGSVQGLVWTVLNLREFLFIQ
ncbi:MAG: DUF1549 domain-containing protein [Verrucomicrobiae bacterium]|nr:DUF1549 domain-containing protein [Verrucomicrobiae bacterium]